MHDRHILHEFMTGQRPAYRPTYLWRDTAVGTAVFFALLALFLSGF